MQSPNSTGPDDNPQHRGSSLVTQGESLCFLKRHAKSRPSVKPRDMGRGPCRISGGPRLQRQSCPDWAYLPRTSLPAASWAESGKKGGPYRVVRVEVHAEAIADLVNDQLATKSDLDALRIAIQGELRELELRLTHEIETLRTTTQSGLETLRTATQGDLETHRTATQRDSKELEVRLLVRYGAMLTAAVAVIAALQELL